MAMWDPWRGCRKCSEGCLKCYIHKGDSKRGIDTSIIARTKDFHKPMEKTAKDEWKMKSGIVYLCFSSDFLIEDADGWRGECWDMIRERKDCTFLFLTKRIERFSLCTPPDWGDGWDNVVVCCTIENQKNADRKLSIFSTLPIKHKCITAQPLIGSVKLGKYLEGIELVVVGGESDRDGRVLDYSWVLSIREECVRHNVSFSFRQCGTHFMKDGELFTIPTRNLSKEARIMDIDFKRKGTRVGKLDLGI